MKLCVATCQFPVDPDIRKNLDHVRDQMNEAHRLGAHVAHFSEGCLSGYAGVEFESFADFDWGLLEESTRTIMELARQLRIWVILGSSHRLANGHKPHNSLYVIDPRGELVDRYDKMFCTGAARGLTEDLKHYSPGDHLVTCEINGVKCGLLICHDFRYPELYREYKRLGAQVDLSFVSQRALQEDDAEEVRQYLGRDRQADHAGVCGEQPHLDQRQQYHAPGILLGKLLRASRWSRDRPAAGSSARAS